MEERMPKFHATTSEKFRAFASEAAQVWTPGGGEDWPSLQSLSTQHLSQSKRNK